MELKDHNKTWEIQDKIMRMLIRHGCCMYDINSKYKTIMFMAIDHNNLRAIEVLVQEGYNVNALTVYGTPLAYAVYKKNYGAAKILLENGANPNNVNPERAFIGPVHDSVLYTAVSQKDYEMADLLLQYGANPHLHVNLTSPYNRAGFDGDVKFFEMFERYGTDLRLFEDFVPLAENAFASGKLEFALYYIRRIDCINRRFKNGHTLLEEAFLLKNMSIVKKLAEWGAASDCSSDEEN